MFMGIAVNQQRGFFVFVAKLPWFDAKCAVMNPAPFINRRAFSR